MAGDKKADALEEKYRGQDLIDFEFYVDNKGNAVSAKLFLSPALKDGDSRSIDLVEKKFNNNIGGFSASFMNKFDFNDDGKISIEEAFKLQKKSLEKIPEERRGEILLTTPELDAFLKKHIDAAFQKLKEADKKNNSDDRFDEQEKNDAFRGIPPTKLASTILTERENEVKIS